tara:strand:- start:11370 stop:11678 length:309 start_codon:yes stop_codon:yes gene_type:complete
LASWAFVFLPEGNYLSFEDFPAKLAISFFFPPFFDHDELVDLSLAFPANLPLSAETYSFSSLKQIYKLIDTSQKPTGKRIYTPLSYVSSVFQKQSTILPLDL